MGAGASAEQRDFSSWTTEAVGQFLEANRDDFGAGEGATAAKVAELGIDGARLVALAADQDSDETKALMEQLGVPVAVLGVVSQGHELPERSMPARMTKSVAFIGTQGSGKSTLITRLRAMTGAMPEDELATARTTATEAGRDPHDAFAFATYSHEHERLKHTTQQLRVMHLMGGEASGLALNLIDLPGGNRGSSSTALVAGANMADQACIVIKAQPQELLETWVMDNLKKGKPLWNQIMAVDAMGVKYFVVVVTAMDTVEWNGRVVKFLKDKIGQILGIKDPNSARLTAVGVSATAEDDRQTNIVHSHGDGSVDNGRPLLDELLQPNVERAGDDEANATGKFRMCVARAFQREGAAVAVGRVAQGVVRVGDRLLLGPSMEETTVEALEINGLPQPWANQGELVGLQLSGLTTASNGGSKRLARGMVLGDVAHPLRLTGAFSIQLAVINHSRGFSLFHAPMVHAGTFAVPCRIIDITHAGSQGGKPVPEVDGKIRLVDNTQALVMLEPLVPVCIEKGHNTGRVVLRDHNTTLGYGKVKEVLDPRQAAELVNTAHQARMAAKAEEDD